MTEHITEAVTCPYCKGTGDKPDQPWHQCGWCMGMGIMHVTRPTAPALIVPQDEPPGRDIENPPKPE